MDWMDLSPSVAKSLNAFSHGSSSLDATSSPPVCMMSMMLPPFPPSSEPPLFLTGLLFPAFFPGSLPSPPPTPMISARRACSSSHAGRYSSVIFLIWSSKDVLPMSSAWLRLSICPCIVVTASDMADARPMNPVPAGAESPSVMAFPSPMDAAVPMTAEKSILLNCPHFSAMSPKADAVSLSFCTYPSSPISGNFMLPSLVTTSSTRFFSFSSSVLSGAMLSDMPDTPSCMPPTAADASPALVASPAAESFTSLTLLLRPSSVTAPRFSNAPLVDSR